MSEPPNIRRYRGIYVKYAKPVIDRVLAAVGLIVLIPVFGLLALLIWLYDKRDVFFRQERIGKEGVPFEVIKFRTMVPGAFEAGQGYVPAGSNLVTPIGTILRRWSLDELPQLINVLKGEMSLVGPRPALPDQVSRYTQTQWQRLTVLPGLTGLAQVEGRNSWPWSKRIERDLDYVKDVSVWLDIKILFRTLKALGAGANILDNQTANEVDDI